MITRLKYSIKDFLDEEGIMKLLSTFLFSMISLPITAQTSPARNWVDTEVNYTDSAGNVVAVQSSLPKGGGRYTDSSGKIYSYVIFWARVTNESTSPMAFTIKFPSDPFTIFPSPESHIRIFLPPDTMTVDKIQSFDYGLTNLQSFLDEAFNKPSMLQKTLNPKEEYYYYIPVLIHEARGTARAALILKEHDLFFKISVDTQSALIPCGQLVYKD